MPEPNPIDEVERLRARDIMIPLEAYPAVQQDASLREAIEVMLHAEIDMEGGRKSLPRVCLVTDESGHVTGILRRRDVLCGLEPEHLVARPLEYRKKWFNVEADPNLAELTSSAAVTSFRERARRPVRDIMLPIRGGIEASDHLMTAISKMVTHDVPLLPILDGDRVVGVLRSVEVFNVVAGLATRIHADEP